VIGENFKNVNFSSSRRPCCQKPHLLTTHFTDMCIPHFFLASERRSTFDVRRRPGYKIWRLFKFKFSDVNINRQCLVLNDRSIDEKYWFTKKWSMVRSREPSLTLGTRLGPEKCPVIQTFLILVILFLNGCILISINPTNIKLWDFVKVNVLFLIMWVLCWLLQYLGTRTQALFVWN
jgi:hypothetical protein